MYQLTLSLLRPLPSQRLVFSCATSFFASPARFVAVTAITPEHLLLHEAQPAHPTAERDGTQQHGVSYITITFVVHPRKAVFGLISGYCCCLQ